MSWWKKLFNRLKKSPIDGQEYRVVFSLYSGDGKRRADICEFSNGETYLDEKEWVAGTTFKNRHSGRMVGPFRSPRDAERFIVTTAWFRARDNEGGPTK